MKVVFMGTPDFAVASLKCLVENGINVVGVITAPDKPAGRGHKLQESAVKQYAAELGLKILQPVNLKDTEFLEDLKSLEADLQVVVAFRMLPEVVWSMPKRGTINLHGSLLPQYRGAAPINWAVINGEKESGVTTFYIKQKIDTGAIIDQAKVEIGENDTAGDLHDRLMDVGAQLLLSTVKDIENGVIHSTEQEKMIEDIDLKEAPKINRETCRISWNRSARIIHNFVRGMSPFPGAWTYIEFEDGSKKVLKIIETLCHDGSDGETGTIRIDDGSRLYVYATTGNIEITKLQLEGKKRMNTDEWLRGVNQDVSKAKLL